MGQERRRGQDDARTLGRGFLVITGAKAWFFVSAAVLNFGLPLLFDSPADYGTYGIVINAVSLLNMVVITGTLQAVAKLVSERPDSARAIVRRGAFLQLFIGLPLAAAYLALAGPIAAWLKDPTYAPLLRLSALVVAGYSFYAVFIGGFNGLKAFTRQASLDILFSCLRVGAILGGVAAGFGVAGAIGGFGLASVVILVVAAVWFGRFLGRDEDDGKRPHVEVRRLVGFLISTMLYTFVLNTLMRIDLFALKRLSADALVALGEPAAAEASNALTGAYNLMLNLARLPYQAVIAVAFVIFPLLSRSTFDSDQAATRTYIRNTMRYTLMIVGLMVTTLAGGGEDFVRPIYPDYAYATSTLLLLSVGYGLFALLYVATTMLIAAGRPWLATGISTATAAVLAGLCWTLIGGAAPAAMLDGAALALAVSMAIGLVVTIASCLSLYGAFLPVRSAVRLLLVIGAVLAVGQVAAFDQFVTFADPLPVLEPGLSATLQRSMVGSRSLWLLAGAGKALGLTVLYIALLLLSREIGPEDRDRFRRVLGKRREDAPQGAAPSKAASSATVEVTGEPPREDGGSR